MGKKLFVRNYTPVNKSIAIWKSADEGFVCAPMETGPEKQQSPGIQVYGRRYFRVEAALLPQPVFCG
jgi:hypothetical protein